MTKQQRNRKLRALQSAVHGRRSRCTRALMTDNPVHAVRQTGKSMMTLAYSMELFDFAVHPDLSYVHVLSTKAQKETAKIYPPFQNRNHMKLIKVAGI